MGMWKGISVLAAETSGQRASRLEIEPTEVNGPVDRKHHLNLLPIQSKASIFITGKTSDLNGAQNNAFRCSATNDE